MPVPNANIARHLAAMAASHPQVPALKVPRGRTATGEIDYLSLTFAELDREVAAWRSHLAGRGVRRGDRTLVMVRPGLPLIAAAFALFQLGAVPVIVDPGMGLRNFLSCVRQARPRVLLGIPFAQWMSRILWRAFRSVEIRVPVSGRLTYRVAPVAPTSGVVAEVAHSAADELAAVLFTSGSTGAPKGVCYEHGQFEAQVGLIRETYGITPGEVDLPLLPIFALFNPALGMTTIVPEIDPRRPADVDPSRIVQAIQQERVTNSFGSPTLWLKISGHCRAQGIMLPTLRRVLCAGAPVPAGLWQDARSWLPNGCLHSPYGATEALPVSSVSEAEIDVASVRGACVGRPLHGIAVKIIGISDAPIATFAGALELATGEIGEIVVHGPNVTQRYDGRPEATAAAKIAAANAERRTLNAERRSDETKAASDLSVQRSAFDVQRSAPIGAADSWHRMGDCGYFDSGGRLWFCGRKVERVETSDGVLHTEPCEQVFRKHPRAARCALIGLGERPRQEPAMVIETRLASRREGAALAAELRSLGRTHPHTAAITTFFFRERFPVDVRHNAKIHRLALAKWAATAEAFRAEEPS
jgi:acyl-CoA synthetase (AMP-forming)/AMP-acid ligase II